MGKKPHTERRQFGRRETHLHAIAFLPGRGGVHCTVTNLSEEGAHLTFSEQVALPPVFRLKVEAVGLERICNVRHQGPEGFGVVFVDQATAQKITAKLEEAARRQQARPSNAPADAGARLRDEIQTASHARAAPEDMRSINHVPGRVIRGV